MLKPKLFLLLILSVAVAHLPGSAEAHAVPKNRAYYESRGDIVWEVPTQDKFIALTFDDGPDAKLTPQILELLEKYDAKATFFVVGERVKRYPELVKKELAAGHEVGNHSFRHPPFDQLSHSSIKDELEQTQQVIFQTTGHKAVLFRPPGGVYNDNIIQLTKQNNLQLILWSWHQDTKDWAAPGVNKIVRKVLDNAHNGDIVLMHDFVYHSSQTPEALKIILPELKKRGFSFVTVSELLSHKASPKQHIEVNH
ncbi:polysaccharide deacetylase family protein [Paenibacillus aceti]|uniref:Polysaccharide deacetylase family sporulation protein PdaB n=1 Tax=Paenibacillus aceti TaxID=1820010 RepID=A0ABQ1W5P9_9BACL|nr:polysaccharide deacetylase family protein [Paenibacillus aceti]GGG16273.1 polysaccharide deacetylase family sporulation protein PdaB [Paenibacillus aceti]